MQATKLTDLNLSKCVLLTGASWLEGDTDRKLLHLQSLNFSECKALTDDIATVIERAVNLESLNVNGCPLLSDKIQRSIEA
jgi:hypothetical protein